MIRGAAIRRRLRAWLLVAIAGLYVLSIPWYRDPEAPTVLWLGLPSWVTVAIGCYVAVALLNAIAWWLTDIRDSDEPGGAE